MIASALSLQAVVADTLPAQTPIGGPIWSVVVPALLFMVAFAGTILLYRRFAGEESKGRE